MRTIVAITGLFLGMVACAPRPAPEIAHIPGGPVPPPAPLPAPSAAPAPAPLLCPATAPGDASVGPRQVIDERQNDRLSSLAFSQDGRLLASASDARVVTVWGVRDRALLRTLRVPGILPPLSVAWGGGESELAVGQGQSLVLDPGSERVLGVFTGDFDAPTGQFVRSLPRAGAAAWFGIAGIAPALFGRDRKLLAKLPWPTGASSAGLPVMTTAISGDGRVAVATAGAKGLVWWDLASALHTATQVAIDGDPVDVAIGTASDRAWVAVRPKQGFSRVDEVDLRGARVPRTVATLSDTADWISKIAASPDGSRIVGGSLHAVTAWELATGQPAWRLDAERMIVYARHDFGNSVESMAFSPVDPLVAVGNARGDVVLIDSRNGRALGELGVGVRRPNELLFSSDSRSFLTLSDYYASRWSIDGARLDAAYVAPGAAAASQLGSGDFLVGRAPFSLNIPTPMEPPAACPVGTVPFYFAPWSQPDDLLPVGGVAMRGLAIVDDPPAHAPNPAHCVTGGFGIVDLNATRRTSLVTLQDGPDKVGLHLGVAALEGRGIVTLADSGGFGFAGALSPDARRACASDLKTLKVWDTASGRVVSTSDVKPGFGMVTAAFSADGARLAVAYDNTVEMLALPAGRREWQGGLNQSLMAIAFAPDGHDVFVGSMTGAVALVHEGRVAWALDGTSGGLTSRLAVSPDRRLLASAHQDGAVRIWDIGTRALRATAVDFDDDEWAITTPGGAFTGTREVGAHVGWVFDAPLERFGFEQFASFRDEATVRQRLSMGAGDVTRSIRRPPEIALASPTERAGTRLRGRLQVCSGSMVPKVLAFRDGRPMDPIPMGRSSGEVAFDLPTLAGSDVFTFVAVDDQGLASRPVSTTTEGTSGARGDLWIVSVGVDSYPHLEPDVQLHAAVQDAIDIADAFARQAGNSGPFAGNPHRRVLTNEQATGEAVLEALGALATMRPDDLAIVFLAGHGVKAGPGGEMRFLTGSVRRSTASVMRDGIGWEEIADRLSRATGRVLVLLDACRSGHISQELVVPNGELAARLSRQGRAGVLVFSAAKGRQESIEIPPHGVFTRAILEALGDPAVDRDRNGRVEVSELVDSVTTRVSAFTHGLQTPWVARRELFGDYAVATASK